VRKLFSILPVAPSSSFNESCGLLAVGFRFTQNVNLNRRRLGNLLSVCAEIVAYLKETAGVKINKNYGREYDNYN